MDLSIPLPPSANGGEDMDTEAAASAAASGVANAPQDMSKYWATAQSNLQQLQPTAPATANFPAIHSYDYMTSPAAAAYAMPASPWQGSPYAQPYAQAYPPTPLHAISAASRLASHRRFGNPNPPPPPPPPPQRGPFRPAAQTRPTRTPMLRPRYPQRSTAPPVTVKNQEGNYVYSDFFQRMIPEQIKEYCDRSFDALPSADLKPQLVHYLKERITPVLDSGVASRVNWEAEPLPHKVEFQLNAGWVPAAQLKQTSVGLPRRNADLAQSSRPPPSTPMQHFIAPELFSRPPSYARAPLPPPALVTPVIPISRRESKEKKKKKKKGGASALMTPFDRLSASNYSGGSNNSKMITPDMPDNEYRKQQRAMRFLQTPTTSGAPTGGGGCMRGFSGSSHKSLNVGTPSTASRRNLRSIIEKVSLKKRRRIIGTCQQVDKPYFRLTTEADPSQVRPFKVLCESLDRVRRIYDQNGDYAYANDQLKSIRQDLIMQDIRNKFSVSTYEEHVLLAIKHKDSAEFNQCQQQLKALYNTVNAPNRLQFTAYRLLYYVYVEGEADATALLRKFRTEIENDATLALAKDVYYAYMRRNYEALLRLYDGAPTNAQRVMNFFISRERTRYLKCILAAYRPTLTTKALARLLHMRDSEVGEFLGEHEMVIDKGIFDVRKYANVTIGGA